MPQGSAPPVVLFPATPSAPTSVAALDAGFLDLAFVVRVWPKSVTTVKLSRNGSIAVLHHFFHVSWASGAKKWSLSGHRAKLGTRSSR